MLQHGRKATPCATSVDTEMLRFCNTDHARLRQYPEDINLLFDIKLRQPTATISQVARVPYCFLSQLFCLSKQVHALKDLLLPKLSLHCCQPVAPGAKSTDKPANRCYFFTSFIKLPSMQIQGPARYLHRKQLDMFYSMSCQSQQLH